MARNSSESTAPDRSSNTLDEMNVARLSLISLQRQVSESYTSWKSTYELDGTPVLVDCASTVQVPHGIDTEVYLGILKIYQLSGCPADGRITVTPHELLATAGIEQNSRAYKMLKRSLDRLNRAIYEIEKGWRDHEGMRWHSVRFQHIRNLEYTKNEDHHLDNASIIHITLHEATVRSIVAGYLNPVNYLLLQQLRQPTSVALCRTLEALRRDSTTTQVIRERLEFNLLYWAQTLRLDETRPDNIRRTLKKPHEELIENNYLQSVEFQGRGAKQTIVYTFSPYEDDQGLQELVVMLSNRGVAVGSAKALVSEYPDRVLPAITRFDQLRKTDYPMKSPGGLLADMVKRPEKYEVPLPEGTKVPKERKIPLKNLEPVPAEEAPLDPPPLRKP